MTSFNKKKLGGGALLLAGITTLGKELVVDFIIESARSIFGNSFASKMVAWITTFAFDYFIPTLLIGVGIYFLLPEKLSKKILRKLQFWKVKVPDIPDMKDIFSKDFSKYMRGNNEFSITIKGKKITIETSIMIDFMAGAKFFTFIIPYTDMTYDVCANIPSIIEKENFKNGLSVTAEIQRTGEHTATSTNEFIFTRLIYVYHRSSLNLKEMGKIEQIYEEAGYKVILRGPAYVNARWAEELK